MKTEQKCGNKRKIKFSNNGGRSIPRTCKPKRGLQFTEQRGLQFTEKKLSINLYATVHSEGLGKDGQSSFQ
jgi:hypothetical protein